MAIRRVRRVFWVGNFLGLVRYDSVRDSASVSRLISCPPLEDHARPDGPLPALLSPIACGTCTLLSRRRQTSPNRHSAIKPLHVFCFWIILRVDGVRTPMSRTSNEPRELLLRPDTCPAADAVVSIPSPLHSAAALHATTRNADMDSPEYSLPAAKEARQTIAVASPELIAGIIFWPAGVSADPSTERRNDGLHTAVPITTTCTQSNCVARHRIAFHRLR